MKKIIRSQRWFFITSCIALLSVGLSACSSTEDDMTSPSTPDVPISKDFKIEDIDLEFDYMTNRDGRQSGGFFKIGFIKERIKVTRKDNTYTVVCENKDSYNTEFLSFDVTMQDNKFGPITNLTAGRTSNDGKDKFSFDATDIELSSSNSELATWKGYDKNGMKVSNLSGHNEYWTDIGYIADPKNRLRIAITPDDEYE